MTESEITKQVEKELESLMEAGATDKNQIFDTVVKKLDVPRPIVKKIARNLRIKLQKRIAVLQSDGY